MTAARRPKPCSTASPQAGGGGAVLELPGVSDHAPHGGKADLPWACVELGHGSGAFFHAVAQRASRRRTRSARRSRRPQRHLPARPPAWPAWRGPTSPSGGQLGDVLLLRAGLAASARAPRTRTLQRTRPCSPPNDYGTTDENGAMIAQYGSRTQGRAGTLERGEERDHPIETKRIEDRDSFHVEGVSECYPSGGNLGGAGPTYPMDMEGYPPRVNRGDTGPAYGI